jgi:hypothetical protein
MPTPCVSLRCDQLIPINKAVNVKEQLDNGLEEEEDEKQTWAWKGDGFNDGAHHCAYQ